MHKQTSFVITAAILMSAVVTIALYTVNSANAQAPNATMAGGAMNKTNATTTK